MKEIKEPFEYVIDCTELRPSDGDFNFNYIHQEIGFNLASEIVRLRELLHKLSKDQS